MGSSVSQEINGAANASFTAIYSTDQQCITAGSQGQQIEVRCPYCRNTRVRITGNQFNQVATYHTQCLADIEITNDIQNSINQEFAAKAEAVAQQFQLSASSVKQVFDISSTIANDITSETSQRCANSVGQTQGTRVTCGGSEAAPADICDVIIDYQRYDQRYEPLTNCVLQNRQATQVINEVIQKITAEGSARVESMLGPIIFIVLIVLAVVGYTYTQGAKALTDWRLWAIVIGLILLFLLIAYIRNWFPFDIALE